MKRGKFLVLLGITNIVMIFTLSILMTGCASSAQSVVNNAKNKVMIRNLLHQEGLNKTRDLTIKPIKVSDVMKEDKTWNMADPIKPTGINFISEFTNNAIATNPGLNLRKYSTTILSSKTGQKATYSTDFKTLSWYLASWIHSKYYFKKKYLDMIIKEEAGKRGYKNYINNIKKGMLNGIGYFEGFVANTRNRSAYMAELEQVTYRAIALYNLSSESPKISAIVYYLQQNNFNKVDEIISKKWKKIAKAKAERLNKQRYSHMKKNLLIYRNINTKDLKKQNDKFSKFYFAALPLKIATIRKYEIKKILSTFFKYIKQKNFTNGLDIYLDAKDDAEKMFRFSLALWYSGNKNPYILLYSTGSRTCLEASLNAFITGVYANMYGGKTEIIDDMAYNISTLEDLNCPEKDLFKNKLDKVLKRFDK